MEIVWKEVKQTFGGMSNKAYAGKFNVGSVFYSSYVPRGDPNKYQAYCSLPGIKDDLGHFPTRQDAIDKVNSAVLYWFSGALNDN